jgi:hypothetical protein
MRAVVKYLPVQGLVVPGDTCFHYRYGLGILKAVNPHNNSFEWHPMCHFDESYSRSERRTYGPRAVNFLDETMEPHTLVAAHRYACAPENEIDGTKLLTWVQADGQWHSEIVKDPEQAIGDGWVQVIAPLSPEYRKRTSYNQLVDGEVETRSKICGSGLSIAVFRIKCGCCDQLT